jgi:hypothetical protein
MGKERSDSGDSFELCCKTSHAPFAAGTDPTVDGLRDAEKLDRRQKKDFHLQLSHRLRRWSRGIIHIPQAFMPSPDGAGQHAARLWRCRVQSWLTDTYAAGFWQKSVDILAGENSGNLGKIFDNVVIMRDLMKVI